MADQKRKNRWFFGGVSSACAVAVTHPFDLIKVHLQSQQQASKSFTETIKTIHATSGVYGFYQGISASIMRQLTYATTRFGIYEVGKNHIDVNSLGQSLTLASFAGFCGGFVGVPSDVVNVRMQNDITLPPDKRRNYKHVFDGFYRIANEEGVQNLFTGTTVAVARGVLITIGQNLAYDQFKKFLISTGEFQDNLFTHFIASFGSGATSTMMTLPLDVVKTRMMLARKENGDTTSIAAIVADVAKAGPRGFFKGFLPSFLRVAPQAIITFLIMEQLRLHFGYLPKSSTS